MNEARVRIALNLATDAMDRDWCLRELHLPCGMMDEDEARAVAHRAVVADDVGALVEVAVPGWAAYFRVELERFFGPALQPIVDRVGRHAAEQLFDSLATP